MAPNNDEGYVPTLGEYAAVIGWLWEERHDPTKVDYTGRPSEYGLPRSQRPGVPTTDMPEPIRKAFNDALKRAAMRRVAQTMGDRLSDGGDDGDA